MSKYLKKGHLLKCPQKARAFKKWNSRWFVLYGNSTRGRVRLEYYDNEKAWQQEKGKRIIPLVHCVSIKPVWNKDYNHVIEIVTSDKTFYLGAGSKDEEKAWFKSLCKEVFGNANRNSIVTVVERPDPLDMGYHSLDRAQEDSNMSLSQASGLVHSSPQLSRILGSNDRIADRDTSLNDPLNLTDNSTETVSRNAGSSLSCELSSIISFESGFDDGASMASSMAEGPSTYHVSVRPTIASQQARMEGLYMLQITPLTLTLMDIPTQSLVVEWPIQHLRRYGRGKTKFSFEAGDKCKSAIGVFTFNTVDGDAIFHQIDGYAKKLSSLKSVDPREKRISLQAEQFRALADTKRRTRSEGKLLDQPYESRSNSTMSGLDGSMEKMNLGFQNSFPSKSRSSTLDAIKDSEPQESAGELESRAPTNLPLESVSIKNAESDGSLSMAFGESIESLLKNPASSEIDLPNKADDNVSKNSSIEQDIRDVRKLIQSSFERLDVNEADTENGVVTEQLDLPANEMLIDGPSRDSPFEPVSTSESLVLNCESSSNIDDIFKDADLLDSNKRTTDGNIPKDVNSEVNFAKTDEGNLELSLQQLSPENTAAEDAGNSSPDVTSKKTPMRKKLRRQAYRNKSFELGSMSEKKTENRGRKQSGSFSFFDYRKYTFTPEQSKSDNGPKKLQRFSSVKKTVEMYEKLSFAASESRLKGFTLWRRKSTRSSQKPEVIKREKKSSGGLV